MGGLGLAVGMLAVGKLGDGVALAQAPDAFTIGICAEAELEAAKQGLAKSGPGADGKGFTILMYKYRFCPQEAKLATGTAVTWINVDKRTSHSVWLKEAGRPESDRLFNAEAVTVVFDRPGTYRYLCGPHWEKEGMSGTLLIR
ncbi:MAG: hypothetical protein IT565_06900 [Rhodospirillales bacterium]|nr:hypothetical protein [Rhodospirillales bacterium]